MAIEKQKTADKTKPSVAGRKSIPKQPSQRTVKNSKLSAVHNFKNKTWTVQDSLKLYNIENWGLQYFGVNEAGNLTVNAKKNPNLSIDLMQVVDDIVSRGVQLPLLIRFQDILRHRVVSLNEAFRASITESKYTAKYQGVYPVKVNQLREVVEEILDAGEPYGFGLEAGSKAELLACLAINENPGSLIICNGYKDASYIRTALLGLKLGKKVIIVVEKLTELYQVLEIAEEINIRPFIGIRSKLHTRGSGRWEASGGEGAKFGLTTPEILQSIKILKEKGMEDCLKLLHFHIGSQITDIRTISDAVKEGSRVYCKIRKMGVGIEYLDVGGGLGVDYDGSQTAFDSSINYSLEEYVNEVVYTIQEVCAAEEVPEPNIVSESGRATAAYHSVLVINVFGAIEIGKAPLPLLEETTTEADVVSEMREILANIEPANLLQSYHEALGRYEEAFSMFKLGFLELDDKAKIENLFWAICQNISQQMRGRKRIHEELEEMRKSLADQYLCNFSLFQSAPDHWAIDHLFPIVPLHRLDERPSREATLVDITCDSDGKVDKFIDVEDVKDCLPLHEINGKPYYVGMFLMGAYQDIMGDTHNLFGNVNEVHVFEDEDEPGGYYIEEVIPGSTVEDMLNAIQYSSVELSRMIKKAVDVQVKAGALKPREGVELLNHYEAGLKEYTYINNHPKI